LDKLEKLLKDDSAKNANTNFHFLDIKNAEHLDQDTIETSQDSVKFEGSEKTDGNVKHLVQSLQQGNVENSENNSSVENELAISEDGAEQVLFHTVNAESAIGNQNESSDQPNEQEVHVKSSKANLLNLTLQAKSTGEEKSVDELVKEKVILLNSTDDEDDSNVQAAKTSVNDLKTVADEPRANGQETLRSNLDQSLEVTDELAEEIAKLEKTNQQSGADKPEYIIVKSPVQSNDESGKPVLFLINAKDIQVEPNQSQKLTLVKNEMVNGDKSQTVDGTIKINFTPSEDTGENKGDGKDGDQSKNNKSGKLPELTQSAFQISKSIHEQSDEKRTAASSETFRAQVKAGIDQTTVETKTEAQPVSTNSSESVNVNNASSSNTTQTTVTTGQEVSSNTPAQQTNSAQAAVKTSTPPELPQAYKDAATQQIVRGVQSSMGSERSHVSIHLTPESLGKVDIQLKMENGMMTAHIVAEKESTQSMLEKNAGMLKAALEEKNIQIDKVHISRDTQEFRNSQQEQNRSNERWREYQENRHNEQNSERRDQNRQQQDQQQHQPNEEQKPWQSITRYMDRFFQRTQA
jgi:flagellar hook-length control protein FliK